MNINNDNLILPSKFSSRIYYISFLTIFPIMASIYFRLYNFTIVTTSVFVSSINYWRYPIKGIRRNIDMTIVSISFLYQSYIVILYTTYHIKFIYYLFNFLSILCYIFARKSKNYNRSSIYHCGIHILSNISNIILYVNLYKNNIIIVY